MQYYYGHVIFICDGIFRLVGSLYCMVLVESIVLLERHWNKFIIIKPWTMWYKKHCVKVYVDNCCAQCVSTNASYCLEDCGLVKFVYCNRWCLEFHSTKLWCTRRAYAGHWKLKRNAWPNAAWTSWKVPPMHCHSRRAMPRAWPVCHETPWGAISG